jgi:hypothetical protein
MATTRGQKWQDILALVVEFLNEDAEGGKKLWDVLTALRGPDDDYLTKKRSTTSVLRHAIGLTYYGLTGAIINQDTEEYAKYRATQMPVVISPHICHPLILEKWTHFHAHTLAAFQVLGLKWDKVNRTRKGEL